MFLSIMRFGIYVHIPHCLRRCHYCDFATTKFNSSEDMSDYTQILLQEIKYRNKAIPYRAISTIYFGGGTPSLAGPQNIAAVIQALGQCFDISQLSEVTLEMNPGTLSNSLLEEYLCAGVTRFSLGAQSFKDSTLVSLGREHDAATTRAALEWLNKNKVNFTADLLFGTPLQTIEDLQTDVDSLLSYSPPHVSAYCLTLPAKHPFNKNRPDDFLQAEMFYLVSDELEQANLLRYEISNFAKKGFESVHNSLYWTGAAYWGIGMAAHSYLPEPDYGIRFWNPPTVSAYKKQVSETTADPKSFSEMLPKEQHEILTKNQALTDFCYTRLRTMSGMSLKELEKTFGIESRRQSEIRLKALQGEGLVCCTPTQTWALSKKALVISDQVFQEMTFLPSDLF